MGAPKFSEEGERKGMRNYSEFMWRAVQADLCLIEVNSRVLVIELT